MTAPSVTARPFALLGFDQQDWLIAPELFIPALVVGLVALITWLRRERIMTRQRRRLRALMRLAENLLSALNTEDLARMVKASLPPILGAHDADLYLLDREKTSLEAVRGSADSTPLSIKSPAAGLSSVIALAFRNRAMLVIPNTRDSPLFAKNQTGLEAAYVFAPMIARSESIGILAITFRQRNPISKDEQAAVQHVANQIATSFMLQQQNIMREQLLRTEKLAATSQIMPGIASELRVPLQAIYSVTQDMLQHRAPDSSLASVAEEAQRAIDILSRLVSFGDEQVRTELVDVGELLRKAVAHRRREWDARRFNTRISISSSPLNVVAVASQLDQVFLNLLLSAEHALENQAEQRITIEADQEDSAVIVAIEFTGPPEGAVAASAAESGVPGALGLQVCQSIVEAHHGEFRLRAASNGAFRFELELPAEKQEESEAERFIPNRSTCVLTALVVEPDLAFQRKLISLLSERGHRSIPVATGEEGIDISHRLKFDLVFCSARLSGLNWAEFHNGVKRFIPTFVLLSDGFDPSLSRSFRPGEGYIVNRMSALNEIERVLAAVEAGRASITS